MAQVARRTFLSRLFERGTVYRPHFRFLLHRLLHLRPSTMSRPNSPLIDIPSTTSSTVSEPSNTVLLDFLNNDSDEVLDFIVAGTVQWMVSHPTVVSFKLIIRLIISYTLISNLHLQASHFSRNHARVPIRAVSWRIREIEEADLPSVIRVFVDSVAVVCGDLIDEWGYLKLQNMATTVRAISAMDTQFWTSNPSTRSHLVAEFPRLNTWMVFVGEMAACNRYPIRGSDRRVTALRLILNILWIMRSVGNLGVQFIKDRLIWKDAMSIWARTQNCSIIEENRLAAIFLEAHDCLPPGLCSGIFA